MPAQRYRIVFEGKILKARDPDEVKGNLTRLFKINNEKIGRYFVGRPIVIQSDVDYQMARKFQQAFRMAGAICRVEAMESYPESVSAFVSVQQDAPKSAAPAVFQCPKCGFEQQRSDRCIHCGIILEISGSRRSSHRAQVTWQEEERNFAAFIENNADKYLNKFKKFNISGVDRFSVSWHWPAFFVGFWWMLYRKLYLWALIAFVLLLIPVINILAWITWPMSANYIYYKHVKRRIAKFKASSPSLHLPSSLPHVGGVNGWVATLGIVMLVLVIAGVGAYIVIPMYL
jgi:hypothetical protein